MNTACRLASYLSVRLRQCVSASLLLTAFALLSTNAAAQNVTVAGSTGANGPYLTLGAAFAAINANANQTGNAIAITIVNTTAEGTATATLNQPSGGSWATLTIKPAPDGLTKLINGSTTAGNPLIDFNGADNVTIDGDAFGSRNLVLNNITASATAGTSTVRFINGATGNTITNSQILGSSSSSVATSGGTILFSTDTVTANGNDNNTISNNVILPTGVGLHSKAILCMGSIGTAAIGNSGLVITNNIIGDYFSPTTTSAGVAFNAGCSASSITNNRFYQGGVRTWTIGALHSAIFLDSITAATGVQGMTITGNIIGYSSSTQSGTYDLSGGGTTNGSFRGISFRGIPGGAVSDISNNTIAAVSLTSVTSSGTSTSAPLMGIFVNTGVVNSNGNTIGSLSATGSITYSTSAAANAEVYGIFNFSVNNWTANNNNVGGITASNTSTGAANVYGLRADTAGTAATTMNSNVIGGTIANSIQSTSIAAASQVIGIRVNLTTPTVTQNIVRNLTAAGGTGSNTTASVIGISFTTTSSVNTASQNTISKLHNSNATAATAVTGIQFTGPAAGNVVARNFIHSITSASNSTAGEINGIKVAGGGTTYRNNMIAVGAGVASAEGTISGIFEVGGSNNFFHNSVYMAGAPTGGFGASYAFNSAVTTNTRSVRNNIFFNARSNNGAGGSNIAVRLEGAAPNPTGLTINNNVYFANGAGGVFGYFNSAVVTSLAAWKTAVGQDAASFQSDPKYLAPSSATPDLHIDPAATTVIEAGGADVGVLDDFDGQTRSFYTPTDIGADARNFQNTDLIGPEMTYTPLAPAAAVTNRVLAVTIIDQTGVAIGSVAPRIHFSKNGGAYVSTVCLLTSGTVQSGVWNCTIDNALIGGVVTLDSIRYFVVAQDTLGRTEANPSAGFVGSNVNSVTTPPTSPNQYVVAANLAGSIAVGAAGSFNSLTNTGGLFEAINAGALGGNLTINITSDLTNELGTFALNEWTEQGAGNYTLLIKPSGGPRTVSGSNAGALIRLNGADRVTIDGSTTGATATGVGGNPAIRELTIQNTNVGTATAVILVASGSNGAQNNTLRNLNVLGQDPLTTGLGISLGGTSPGTVGTDNDNNRVENCSVKRVLFGIYSAGVSAANPNTGTVITMNETSSVTADRASRVGIVMFNDNGAQITQNSINGVSTTAIADAVGIALGTLDVNATTITSGGVSNALVARNKIDGVANPSANGFSAAGIAIAGTTGGANTIVNNMITGVTAPATSPDIVAGIFVAGETGSVTRLHHNSVAMTGDRGASATQLPSYGVAITGADPTVELKNNIFYTTQTSAAGGADAKSYAIGVQSTTFANLDSNYNDFFSAGANAGFFRSGSLGSAAGTDYATLALWRTATAKDANSLEVDPAFVNPLNNVHLSASSPLASAGITGFATVDFDNQPRPAANPAIGADQFLTNTLTVSKTGSGTGTVTSADGSINCGATCTAAVNLGTVTLTATPAGASVFTGWQGACTGAGTCTVTMNGARSVTATFAAAAVGTRILDINNDNQYLPESDGVLVLRYLFGLRGAALTNGLTLTGSRTNATQIEAYLGDILPYLDVDGNGVVDALTDGLLIIRQLITPSVSLLIQNALGVGATRTTATDVNSYILTLRP